MANIVLPRSPDHIRTQLAKLLENFTLQNMMGTLSEPWFRKVLKDGARPQLSRMR
jgi:hypothetical protein